MQLFTCTIYLEENRLRLALILDTSSKNTLHSNLKTYKIKQMETKSPQYLPLATQLRT